MFRRVLAIAFAFLFLVAWTPEANAGRPSGYATVKRRAIRNMHILDRPNRPFHFYGNTVRRLHRARIIRR